MVQGGTVNALEGAQAESPSKNTHKVKSNCQKLPFSCTPAVFILPTDQLSQLGSSGAYVRRSVAYLQAPLLAPLVTSICESRQAGMRNNFGPAGLSLFQGSA